MKAVPELESTHQPVKDAKKPSMFNLYPVLGIVLLILLAAMVYGGLLIFLLEESPN